MSRQRYIFIKGEGMNVDFKSVVLLLVLVWFVYLSIEVASHVDAWPF